MQFHPLAYIVKLNIEMTMSELISKVARAQNNPHGAVMPSTTTGDRSGGRSRMTRGGGDDKTLTQSKINAFNGPVSEDMEMGILENSGPPNNNRTEIEADASSTDGSDRDDESINRNGFVVRRKQEFHVRVESATPSPNTDTEQRRLHGPSPDSSRLGNQNQEESTHTQWGSY